jgi:nucleotide-binding universal stress UspA family protein
LPERGILPVIVIERILVPIDFSPPSLKALDEAVEFGRPYGAEIIVMCVLEREFHTPLVLVPDPRAFLQAQTREAEERLAQIAARLNRQNVKHRTLVEFGVPYQVIVESARRLRANLIVMSTHGRTGLAHALIGSVAERVVQHAHCPILLLRPPPAAKPRGRQPHSAT